MFEHEKIKSMLKCENKKNGDSLVTLWNTYSKMPLSYARFGVNIKKTNFANVLLPINGINIILGSKYSDRLAEG
jgi:hypothetical protein